MVVAVADGLVDAVSVGHETADVPVMVTEDAEMVVVVVEVLLLLLLLLLLLGLGPGAADVVATEPVGVQDQVEDVQNRVEVAEEAADVQEVEVEVEGQVEDQVDEVEELEVVEEFVEAEEAVPGQGSVGQVVAGVLVPVDGEWLVCQPVFVGQFAFYMQYAGSLLPHSAATTVLAACLVVVLVER